MVYRNNVGRLDAGFISVCLETRWLGQKSDFYVPESYCMPGIFFGMILFFFLSRAIHSQRLQYRKILH